MVYQTYAILVENRDKVCERMKERDVQVIIHYPIPVHLQEAYQDLGYQKGDFPQAELVAQKELFSPDVPSYFSGTG